MRVRQWGTLWNSSCLRSGPFGGPLGTVLVLRLVAMNFRFTFERCGINFMLESAGVAKGARSLCKSSAVLDFAIRESRHSVASLKALWCIVIVSTVVLKLEFARTHVRYA